ncbi:Slam-dependent surface lipoprotein [Moraxella oblonga]|uniref:Slam-dependent surface lipoprotein n=1 Tax=Moraxella oblonga TaxID=200413 RepID=UPI00082D7C7C|nr:Slam-dependent surface lipoprotein [Moraxella oblonga]
MKKSTISLALVTSMALALTACGGGGSSGGSTTSPSTPVVKPNPTNSNTNPQTNTQTISGKAIAIPLDDNSNDVFYKNINGNNINTLNVDGKTFTIGTSGINANSFTTINSATQWSVISGTHLQHAKYGYYNNKKDNEYLFYQGEKTPVANLPKGVVNYTGRSIYLCETCNEDIIQGTSKFTADFGKKTLTGSISNAKASNIALNATISGNTFAGKNNGTQVDGAFFGNNAQELSGYFINEDKAFAGAFGASKQ